MAPLAFRAHTLTRLIAVAQLALPLALGAADAITAGRGGATPSHVEATYGQKCSAAHVDDCIVCRHLSTSAIKAHRPPVIAAGLCLSQLASTREVTRRSTPGRQAQPRAPPHS